MKAGLASNVNKNDFSVLQNILGDPVFVVSFCFIPSAAIVCWRSSVQKGQNVIELRKNMHANVVSLNVSSSKNSS